MESELSEESFVVEGDINNHDVIVVDDICGFDIKSVYPVDGEFFNSDVVFEDDSCLGLDIEGDVVDFDLFNSDLSLNNDCILVLNKDSSLDSFSLSNDLKSVGFNLDEGIVSEELNLSVNIGINFNSDGNDHVISFLSDDGDGMLDVKVDLFSDDGDFNFSPVPEVGSFDFDVNQNGLVEKFECKSTFFFDLADENCEFEVNSISSLLNKDVHFKLEVKNNEMSFFFNSTLFMIDEKIPVTYKDNDQTFVIDGELLDFLKIVVIDFLDS